MKNLTDPIENQAHDLLACSTVPEQTALPHTPMQVSTGYFLLLSLYFACSINPRNVSFSYLLQLLVQRHHELPVSFLGYSLFLLEMLQDQDTVDQESS
jgi:hypothetical protein